MDNNWLTGNDIFCKDSADGIELRPGAVRAQNIAKAMWSNELSKMCVKGDTNRFTPTYSVPVKLRWNSAIKDQSKYPSRDLNEITLRSLANSLSTYSYITADSQSRSNQSEKSFGSTASTSQERESLEYAKLFQRKGFQEVTSALNETSDLLPDKLWRPYLSKAERKIWMDPVKEKLNKKPTLPDKYPDPPVFTASSTPRRTATYKRFRRPKKDRATTSCMSCNATELADTQSKSYRNVLIGDPLDPTSKKTEVTFEAWSPFPVYERITWRIDLSALIPIRDESVGNDSSNWSTETPCSSDDTGVYMISPIKNKI